MDGSASAATSGTTRIGVVVVPSGTAVARLLGTTTFWYHGWAYAVDTPPPPEPP